LGVAREPLKTITTVGEMQAAADAWRRAGRTIGLVPTMGFFHEGHLTLMRQARQRADIVVVSLFVNPTQFAANEDLSRYPRDFERDRAMAESVGVDVIFFPDAKEMYPAGYQTTVAAPELSQPLCGKTRPTHFAGVATVCCKLFNIVKPHFAVFGEKDYQQLLVVTRMAADLNLDLEIVPGPTVREPDGLAMSSRNVYLSPPERAQAVWLSRSLQVAADLLAEGETCRDRIVGTVWETIRVRPLARIDYVELRRLPDLAPADEEPHGKHLLALAVYFGPTRLIDNTVLSFPE
jgi:pantoate--beta-alanine ligase